MPLMFSLIFGTINFEDGSSAAPRVAIVVAQDELAEVTANLFEHYIQYDWIEAGEEEAKQLVSDQDVIAALVIPTDLRQRLAAGSSPFDMIVNQKTERYIALSQYVTGTANNLSSLSQMLQAADDHLLIEVIKQMSEQDIVAVEQVSYQQFIMEHGEAEKTSTANGGDASETIATSRILPIGFSIMFMMFALSSSAAIIHNERKDYTWQRLTTTAASRRSIVSGYISAFWLIGWAQFAVIMIFMWLMFGTTWGNFAMLLPFISLTILTIVAYSMMMATIVTSKKQAAAMNAIIIVSTCMLGGVYWSIDIVPHAMQLIANYIPQYWMMKGLQNVMLDQTSWSIMWKPWAILAGFSVLFLGLAIRQLTKEQRA